MEGNKDDAAKCLRIAKDALQAGDRARALKFLTKASRLDPSLPMDDLISAASGDGDPPPQDSSAPSPSSSSSSSATPSSSAARARPRAKVPASDGGSNTNSAASASASASASYTEEQVEIVREVKRKQKDYYSILGVEKSCTVEDVRKAYRKLSLKVHPDKNKAPGAEDAFKVVSKAFQCLSNEETRKRYDMVGCDEPVTHTRSAHSRHRGYDGFYEGEFDADEIFRNFFFGGGMAPARTAQFGGFHFRTGGMGMNRGAAPAHQSGSNAIRMLVQILPVIILLLLSFLPSSEPVYALSRSYPYEHKMVTGRGSVPYYVKSAKYEEEYPHQSAQREALEQRIEREYVGVVTQNCRMELQRRQWGMSHHTPHCDLLNKYEQAVASA